MRHPAHVRVAAEPGFSLILMLLWTFLAASLLLFLHQRLTARVLTGAATESQLYSLVMAENGVEYARAILPGLEITSLLPGLDGSFSQEHPAGWRNPMLWREAGEIDPASWSAPNDDGLPFFRGEQLLPFGYSGEGGGSFFLKFSNNPEEDPENDEDGIVLVRSLGIVKNPIRHPLLPGLPRNSVSLVEARFRQEQDFFLRTPLVLFGDRGNFEFEGTSFVIRGDTEPAVSFVHTGGGRLREDLEDGLSPEQQERLQGGGTSPSWQDSTQSYRNDARLRALFLSSYWNHFERQLPALFPNDADEKIRYVFEGGVLNDSFSGVLIAKGELILQGRAQLNGVLIHLGGGRLVLRDEARVTGALWMSHLDTTGQQVSAQPLSLKMSGSAALIYDEDSIREAISWFPPTQLSWRLLFPEMPDER